MKFIYHRINKSTILGEILNFLTPALIPAIPYHLPIALNLKATV